MKLGSLLTFTFNKSSDDLAEYCGPNASLMSGNRQTRSRWPKKTFAYANQTNRLGCRIQRLMHPAGCPAKADQEMADLVKETFQSFYRADKRPAPTFHPRIFQIRMVNLPISESKTHRDLEVINPNMRTGPDGLFSKVLKTLSHYIAPVLSSKFNPFLQTSQIPHNWRNAIVTQLRTHPKQRSQSFSVISV